jgi:HAD superfamily hydrolase (TIGR01509 family)
LKKLRGVIFDLDGTLVDSGLDFNAMRREMRLPAGQPILEALEVMRPGADRRRCLGILKEHERRGARNARVIPGVVRFLEELSRNRILTAVLTRNSRETTQLVLRRLSLNFSRVLTREDVLPKPDPAGLLKICRQWDVSVNQVLFFGDHAFDMRAGKNAKIRTVFYAPNGNSDDQADFVVRDYSQAARLIERFL